MLALIIAGPDPERLRTGLVLAAAQSALGETVHLFFQGDSLGLIRQPIADPDALRQAATGLPTLAQLFEEALGLGATVGGCQSSLALLKLTPADFDPRVEWGGMVGLMSRLGTDDRLLVV